MIETTTAGCDAKARVLITGGSGFVGTALVRLLAAEHPQCRVHAIGHEPGGFDIGDPALVADLVERTKPTAIVHLAAIAAPAEAKASPRQAWNVNLTGTLNVAEAIQRHAPDARLVFAGSSESYGAYFKTADGRPVREDAPLLPQTVYAATKASADLMLSQMAMDGLDVVRFRPFNHTGPGQPDKFVVPAFARQVAEAAAGRRARVIEVGNLDAERDFMDVRDVVRAYAKAALEPGSALSGKVYNLASGKPIAIKTILERLIAISGADVEVRTDPSRLRRNEIPVACGDASAARADLGWSPVIQIEQTLNEVFDYWKALAG